MKRILCMLLAVCMVALLCTACGGTNYKEIQCPVEKLTWGMTWEEVVEALALTGDEVEQATAGNTSPRLTLSPERVGLENGLCGLPPAVYQGEGTDTGYRGVYLEFSQDDAGDLYLDRVWVRLLAADEEALAQALGKTYGKPVDTGTNCWVSTDPKKQAGEGWFEQLPESDRSKVFMTAAVLTGEENGETFAWQYLPQVYVQNTGGTLDKVGDQTVFPVVFDARVYVHRNFKSGTR